MGDLTLLLAQASGGDARAANALFDAAYGELRILARGKLRHHGWQQGSMSELDACALVSEAWLRMNNGAAHAFGSPAQFFAYMGRVMRSVVVDDTRGRIAAKRDAGPRAPGATLDTLASEAPDLVALEQALRAFERLHTRSHELFEMHFCAGMPVDAICAATALSAATVKRDLRKAREFLIDACAGSAPA